MDPGAEAWRRDPWSGDIADGLVHGRGSVDMKGGVVAALHALAALRAAGTPPAGDVVLQAVPSEEDGGLGTFAALERDDDFAACLIPEPTELRIVCAHGGALTFTGIVRGRAAHAAMRLQGVSAIDRYMPIHAALHAHEAQINARPRHPLLAGHPLPYPLLVGQLRAGRWSSQVPDELRFEGRLGVPVGASLEQARHDLEAAVAAATDDDGPPVEIRWDGGQFAPGQTPVDAPWVRLVQDAAADGARGPAAARRRRLRRRHAPLLRARDPDGALRPQRHRARPRQGRARLDRRARDRRPRHRALLGRVRPVIVSVLPGRHIHASSGSGGLASTTEVAIWRSGIDQ